MSFGFKSPLNYISVHMCVCVCACIHRHAGLLFPLVFTFLIKSSNYILCDF